MTDFTIHDLGDDVAQQLQDRASEHGHTVEEELRAIVQQALNGRKPARRNIAKRIRECFAPVGGMKLELPPRGPIPEPPRFGE